MAVLERRPYPERGPTLLNLDRLRGYPEVMKTQGGIMKVSILTLVLAALALLAGTARAEKQCGDTIVQSMIVLSGPECSALRARIKADLVTLQGPLAFKNSWTPDPNGQPVYAKFAILEGARTPGAQTPTLVEIVLLSVDAVHPAALVVQWGLEVPDAPRSLVRILLDEDGSPSGLASGTVVGDSMTADIGLAGALSALDEALRLATSPEIREGAGV